MSEFCQQQQNADQGWRSLCVCKVTPCTKGCCFTFSIIFLNEAGAGPREFKARGTLAFGSARGNSRITFWPQGALRPRGPSVWRCPGRRHQRTAHNPVPLVVVFSPFGEASVEDCRRSGCHLLFFLYTFFSTKCSPGCVVKAGRALSSFFLLLSPFLLLGAHHLLLSFCATRYEARGPRDEGRSTRYEVLGTRYEVRGPRDEVRCPNFCQQQQNAAQGWR